jgi:glucosamine--fructose-6-phosphate aminotransferase (isomerizing)
VLADLQSFVGTLEERHAEIVTISDDASLRARARVGLALPQGVPEWLSPIVAIVPGQLWAVALATTRGLDPDRPRGLSKVTETL